MGGPLGGWGRQRQPAPPGPSSTGVGPVRFWGQRAAMPLSHVTARGLVVAPISATLPAATWLRASGLQLARHRQDECLTVRGARLMPHRPASAHRRCLTPPSLVALSCDPAPGRPLRKGLRHFVRSITRSLRAAASAAPLRTGLCAWALCSPGQRTQEVRRKANSPLNAKPERQKGALNLGTRLS